MVELLWLPIPTVPKGTIWGEKMKRFSAPSIPGGFSRIALQYAATHFAAPAKAGARDTERMRSLWTTFRPQAKTNTERLTN
ncbi:hypothetical protein GCM10007927_16730 [Sulfitobacter pacificus]|uniref:Uncharacterized protein n=1 Tax=Sulfitobacter pacificus TaxID=1499314 RepID=A0ABQ5VIH6_9RHOB|nr:hypothetical protein GCM10007927_16730 [Sulfitobacter pacificus]